MTPKKVALVGCGNWGSAIARIVGETSIANPDLFDPTIKMWVYEEDVDGRKLSEIINQDHENVKYLPGVKLPENVIGITDVVESCKDADILIFCIPHQFVTKICEELKGKIKSDAIGISLIKGLSMQNTNGIKLVSDEIKDILNIEVAVLMGANLASEVAQDHYCEATIGTRNREKDGKLLKTLFHTDNFRINVVDDIEAVELCGALKNIVACGAGFSDGLGYGNNMKAAVIRLGMMEIIKFVNQFYPGAQLSTFFESCGLADLVTTCHGGRNLRICIEYAKTRKSMIELEKELLNGQSAQGPLTAGEVYEVLEKAKSLEQYPVFVAVHRICTGEIQPEEFIDYLQNHPEHE
uniref:Glycerol-3-phosphate dehydrogenase [NAD(+)] n=2 Tax=Panagrolaimus sp. JU765 TaxID=591449 RepID=A0AC34RMN2_9BILA